MNMSLYQIMTGANVSSNDDKRNVSSYDDWCNSSLDDDRVMFHLMMINAMFLLMTRVTKHLAYITSYDKLMLG